MFFTLNREDFSFVIHLDRQPRTSRRREAQTGSRARSGSRSERTLDAVEHSRTLMEWWPFLIFHRGGLRIKVINNTSVPEQRLSPDGTVRCYKSLSQVERAFRSIKTIDLKVRPIRHRLETRVRAHIFLCMLAYYVEWHMREAWRPLLFCDEDQEAKKTRDPVAPAKRSEAALRKIRSKKLDDGTEAHSFQTLLKALSTIVRNICRAPGDNPDAPTFQVVTTPDPKQQRAYDLLETIIL